MHTYYRPSLTAEQRAYLLSLLEGEIQQLTWDAPEFDPLYRLILKLKDCKEISTGKKGG